MSVRNTAVAWGLALTFAGLAQADPSKGSVSINVLSDASLNGTALPAGNYTIAWSSENAEADVKFTQHGKVVAEGHARVVEEKAPAQSGSLVLRPDGKGALAVAEIHFRGKKDAFVF
jgi:hypothetical protein